MRGKRGLATLTVAVELVMALSLVSSAGLAQSSPSSAIAQRAVQTTVQNHAPVASPGRLLYTAGGSQGFTGWKRWDGEPFPTKYWRVAGGQLLSTGVDSAYVKAPYEPGKYKITDYAVEAQIRVLSLNTALNPPHGFGLVARGNPYQYLIGYQASLTADQTPRPELWFLGGPTTGHITSKQFVQFNPTVWHSYREEVVGKQIRYLIDGVVVLKAVDQAITGGGYVGLGYWGTQVAVRSFKVFALGSVSPGYLPACGTHCGTGAVLYRTSWPQGIKSLLEWSVEGGAPSGWDIKSGMLVTDGNASGGIVQPDISPADLGIRDYAVEAQIQVQSLATVDNPGYGLRIRVAGPRPEFGYGGSVTFRQDKLSGLVDSSLFYEAGASSGWLGGKRFVLLDATRWHTYRLEVTGTRLQYLIDGVVVAAGTSAGWKDGGFGAIRFAGVKMAIRSFTITSLAGRVLPKAIACGEQCGTAGAHYAVPASSFSMHTLLGWTLVAGEPDSWHLEGGQLVGRSDGSASLIKPDYEPGPWGHADYAVEAQIQVRSVQKEGPQTVALLARASDRFGYAVELRLNGTNWDANIWQRGGGNLGSKPSVLAYVPGSWHTLRMEVRGATIRFLIDGALVLQGTDPHPITDGGWAGVQPSGPQIALRSFTISAV